MEQTVEFLEPPLPALQDALWIMQLLAKSARELLRSDDFIYDYEEVGISSIDVPRILGYFAAGRLPALGSSGPAKGGEKKPENERLETLRDIWIDFLREDRIRRLPLALLTLFEQQRDATLNAAATGKFGFDYLNQANHDAHSFVKALLKKQQLDELLSLEPVRVHVVNDLDAKMYCAASDNISGMIQWTHQAVPHALPATVLADRVLAHEYLSHLVPVSRGLGRAVQERWLVALLHETYCAADSKLPWRSNLWPFYRKDLENHVAELESAKNRALNVIRAFGYAGVESAAASLFQNDEKAFWKFTTEIIAKPLDESEVKMIDRLLLHFANRGPERARLLLSGKWKNIKALYASAGSPGPRTI